MNGKTTVFLSFSGLLAMIGRGLVKESDLVDALFYFGCNRDHLFPQDPGYRNSDVRNCFGDNPAGVQALTMIREAVSRAEALGHVGFRPKASFSSLEQLNELLSASGLPEIRTNETLSFGYSYPGIVSAAEEQGHPAQFLWKCWA